jgi:hypothetical protein
VSIPGGGLQHLRVDVVDQQPSGRLDERGRALLQLLPEERDQLR